MFHKDGNRRRTWKGRAFSLFLAAVLLLGSVPGFVLPSSAHWADPYLDQLVDWGVMRADQTSKPDAPLTRAEFMAIINRAYGYHEIGEMPFEDVSEGDWFYDDVAIAYNAGYMKGTSKTTASPNAHLTREQAVCILGRNMMMKETPGEDTSFTDSRSISSWARGMVKTAVNQYIIGGFPDDSFRPKDNITKGQMAVLVTRCVGAPVSQSGDCELGDVFGNVTITAPNVTLRNTTISGDLYISGGVGLGGIKLENVDVLGRIVVSGTGESEGGGASVIMRNVNANELLVDNMQKKYVTVRADGITEIPKTIVRTNAYLEDNNTDKKGLLSIVLEGKPGTRLDLAGRIKEVVNKTPDSIVQVAKGTVAKLTVDEAATNSTVQINRNTRVKELNLDVATTVTGEGDVDKLNINAPGSVVSMLPDDIYIRPGIDGSINGGVMDSEAAEESSLDPRLLAGYPAARDIAPTGFRADFSGNKKGTVYWAVSAITDGSIGADNLISPPSYGSKALRGGSVGLPAGDTVGSTQVNGLSVGGSYYLSAVLVDGRDQRSPVKVISFSTPDNTVPAFGEGYPYMSKISKEVAQVTVLPTKSCKLYYALLPKGAQAPTAAEMKAAAVVGNLGYGVRDVTKNTEDVFTVNDRTLEELKDYVLYLWLTDVDGANSSAVTSLELSIPDETPPVVSMPVQTASTGNSVTLSSSMNEPGTIFWAVVAMDTNYPLPNLESNPLDKDNILDGYGNAISSRLESEYAKMCVESGRGSLVKGSAAVSAAGADVTINVNGRLEPETTYKLFYVGKDTVGNYSVEVKVIDIKTADTSGPIVKQYFRNATSDDKTENPLANDDVVLDFNEPITVDGSKELLSLYEMAQGNGENKGMAQKELQEKLQKNFVLHEPDRYNPNQLIADVTGGGTKGKSWIDYSKVVIQKSADKPGHIEVVFKNGAAIQLKSDTTYYFELKNVRDDAEPPKNPALGSDRRNTLIYWNTENTEHSLKQFSTTFASVNLGDYKQGEGALAESEYPVWDKYDPEVKDEAGNVVNQEGSTTEGLARIDAAFFIQPQSTEGVEDKYFDIAFFASKRIDYDLYYRIVDIATNQVIDIEAEANKDYVLPGAEAKREDETHGWVYLGEGKSSSIDRGTGIWSSSVFNGMLSSQKTFPPLKTLKQGWAYQFAISVTKIGNSESWGTWCEKEPPISIDIHVMSGGTSDLKTYLPTNGHFTPESVTANGSVKSIGTPQPLTLKAIFSDTKTPIFIVGPTFETNREVTSIEDITFNLDASAGASLWYSIMRVSDAKAFPVTITTTKAVGAIPDKTPLNNGEPEEAENFMTVIKEQTKSDNPGTLSYYELKDDNGNIRDNIMNPNYSKDVVKHGSITYDGEGLQTSHMHQEGTWELAPDTEYYTYIVLLPASGTITPENPPQVYVYYFKTDAAQRPKIDFVDQAGGKVDITVQFDKNQDEANLNWALYEQNRALNYLKGREITIPSGVGGPSTMTWLEALETSWVSGTVVGDKQYIGYNYFDAFASQVDKQSLVNMILNSTPIDSINSNVKKQQGKPVKTENWFHTADWATGADPANAPDPKAVEGLMIVAAHNTRSESGESNWWEVDSFSIHRNVTYLDNNAPTLTPEGEKDVTGNGVSGTMRANINKDTNQVTVTGNITLSFNKPVYWRKNGDLNNVDYRVVRSYDDPTGTGDDAIVGVLNGLKNNTNLRPFVTIDEDKGGPFTSFTIKVTDLPLADGQSELFFLLGGDGRIAAKEGLNGGYISIRIENKRYPAVTEKDETGAEVVVSPAYYQPTVIVTHHAKSSANDQKGTITGDRTNEGSGTPETQLPPDLMEVGGTITGASAPATGGFTISANPLRIRFNNELFWKQSGDNTFYEVSGGEAAPSGTTVGLLYNKSYDTPSGISATVSGGESTLTFSDMPLSSVKDTREFTLLPTGKIYSRNGTVGVSGGIKVNVGLEETTGSNTNQNTYYRPVVKITYNNVSKTVYGTPFSVPKPSITVTPKDLKLKIGQTSSKLTAKLENAPTGAVDTVTWSSDNTAVATVDKATGAETTVTAKSAGQATITATYKGSDGKALATDTAVVTVVQPEITVTPNTLSLKKGEKKSLMATANNGPTGSTVEWSSDNTAVATVDKDTGETTTVTAVSAGKATITATCKGSDGKVLATATVAVSVIPSQAEVKIIPPAGLSEAGSNKGAKIQLTVEVKLDGKVDADAAKDVKWECNIYAKNLGNGLFELTGSKGKMAIITATYTHPVDSTLTDDDTWKHSIIETISTDGSLKPIPQ